MEILAFATFDACSSWFLYMALEPYVRRRWPQRIISWSRLLAGNLRDPLVGRDLLIGGLFAIGLFWLWTANRRTWTWLGLSDAQPSVMDWVTLYGWRGPLGSFCNLHLANIKIAFVLLFTLVLLSRLLRKEWLAFGVAWLIFTFLIGSLAGSQSLINWVATGLFTACWIIIQARFGLLATVSFMSCVLLLIFYPITSDFSAWYAQGTIFVLVVYLAICGYGFYTSLGGQKVFAGKLLEE